MTYLLLIYKGGLIPASERAYEDWKDNMMDWEEAIMSAILWPVLTVVWVWYMWRKS
jgi:hypothetical protein